MINEEIGNRLRKLRESISDENGRRYSQGKLIEEFDKLGYKLTQPKLSGLENGESSITPELLILYSDFFNVTSDYILREQHECGTKIESPLVNNIQNTCPCDCENLINEQGIIDNLNEELDLINNSIFSKDFSTPWGFIKILMGYIKSHSLGESILTSLLGLFVILSCISISPKLMSFVALSYIAGSIGTIIIIYIWYRKEATIQYREDILEILEQMQNTKKE
ncbi:MAG: helix-turn-helix transcriptional regulator [Enterocloster citroniae]|nr:helix-turn-helix transcriptional regulator [Enterocloster citroniae]